MQKVILSFLVFFMAHAAYGKTCTGKVKEINHWSDGQENQVNFTLVNGSDKIKITTKTKEQVSMVLTAFASDTDVKAYWSCSGTKPPSCNEADIFPICGYISLNKYE